MARRAKQPRQQTEPFISEKAVGREIERLLVKRRASRFRRARLVFLGVALIIGWLASRYAFLVVTVHDGAMSPAIEAGSTVVCLRQSFLDMLVGILPEEAVRPHRGGVYLLAYSEANEAEAGEGEETEPLLLIRRVLGLPGDVIGVEDGMFTVNGEIVPGEPSGGNRVYPVTVPAGRLFVTGDHRAVSVDSLRRSFGMPEADGVVARPVAIIWPLYEVGLVN